MRPQLQVTYTDGSHATAPTVAVSAPAPGGTVSGSTVTLSAAASSPGSVSKVQFFVDGSSVGSASQAPWQVSWNSATVGNASGTLYQAGWNPATAIVPQAMSYDPSAQSQLTYPVSVTVTNVSGHAWNSATTTLRYRWYLAGSTTSFQR